MSLVVEKPCVVYALLRWEPRGDLCVRLGVKNFNLAFVLISLRL